VEGAPGAEIEDSIGLLMRRNGAFGVWIDRPKDKLFLASGLPHTFGLGVLVQSGSVALRSARRWNPSAAPFNCRNKNINSPRRCARVGQPFKHGLWIERFGARCIAFPVQDENGTVFRAHARAASRNGGGKWEWIYEPIKNPLSRPFSAYVIGNPKTATRAFYSSLSGMRLRLYSTRTCLAKLMPAKSQ